MYSNNMLIEFAAKACGYETIWVSDMMYIIGRCPRGTIVKMTPWNPLENDGDAFRLAISLNIIVSKGVARIDGVGTWTSVTRSGDDMKDTRIAIVRAASGIGYFK
jgi:hypothetical protein